MELNSKIQNVRPLCLINNELIVSKENLILRYDIEKKTLRKILSLPVNFGIKFLMKFKILIRLFRLGVRYGIQIHEGLIIVVFNKRIYEIDLKSKACKEVFKIFRGSAPLNICEIKNIKGFENCFAFGEYFGNFEKDEVHIYKRKINGSWEVAFTFPKGTMEHIHSIVPDRFNDCLWILAGDFANSSCIWMAKDNFSSVIPILRGSQNYRSCVAFATEDGLLYATDSQFESNSIRLLKRNNKEWVSVEISQLNGSSIYGCYLGGENVCFSTTVEGDSLSKGKFLKYLDRKPGPGIKSPESHIVIGNLRDGFYSVMTKKKDIYPFILFQFGTFLFPTGTNKTDKLICYDIGLKGSDLNTYIYNLPKIKNNDN